MEGHTEHIEMEKYAPTGLQQQEIGAGDAPLNVPVSEKVILLEKKHRVSMETAVILRYGAIIISWMSVIASLVLGLTAVVFAWRNDSQSLFSFGLDAVLDCISSVVVLWRFYGGDSLYSEFKERRACALIGMLFVISAFALAGKSIWALAKLEHTEQLKVTLILAGVNVAVCLVLGVGKIVLGHKLESRALITDSVITLVGAVMSVFILIFSKLYQHDKRLWYLDDSFGLLCSLFLLLYGLRVLWTSVVVEKKSKG